MEGYAGNPAASQYGGATQAVPVPQEPVSAVTSETGKVLSEALAELDGLISKHLGPRPTENAKPPEAVHSVRQDAFCLRDLAYQINKRVAHLHEIVGY